MKSRFLLGLLCLLISVSSVFAQGVQTATLQGNVTDASGAALPGVTVSVKSPALMGERTAVTTSTGEYVVRGLPPGDYTITFSLEGMRTSSVRKTLALGLTTVVDAQMKLATVAEAITVTAAAPTVLENQTVGANIKSETVQQLPVLRNPTAIGSLAPGVTGDRGGRDTTPVAGQLSISGGMAYDNNFLINGVNFQDNIFGTANNLFVEDAVQETQVLTSGISAEYGHFTGGVLNIITKSGGNSFSGSLRDDLSNPKWTALTPYESGFRGNGVPLAKEAPHKDKLSNVYEATLGGPIVRDRLWFFFAGRDEKSSTAGQVPATGEPYTVQQTNLRPEVKLTANIASSHTIQADYINNPVKRNLEVQVSPITIDAIGTNSERQNKGYTLYYSGVFSSALFGEARYSKKHFGFRGLGGTATAITESPFESNTDLVPGNVGGTFNAPYFDATDPEDRNNNTKFASLSYFLSKPRIGNHDLKVGFEQFVDERTGGNSQSASNYVFYSGYAMNGGSPALDATGRLIPVFVPYTGTEDYYTSMAYWLATRNAKLDVTTNSLFVNDRWSLNQHWNFNIGARYEKTSSSATGENYKGIDTSNIAPRLGASFDPTGGGKYKFDVTYASYVGRYNPSLTGANTVVGNPALLYGYYIGPPGQGKDFAPGFDPKNYKFWYASVPTANVFVTSNMHAPVVNEITASAGIALTKNSWTKFTLTNRKYKDVIEDFITYDPSAPNCTEGPVTGANSTHVVLGGVDAGCFDNILYRNSGIPKREYQAGELQAHYDIFSNWAVEGNWTHQFKNDGNYEGESGQTIPTSPVGNRVEMQSPRELPTGHLAQYEANRVRLWTTYTLGIGRAGSLSTGLLYRYDSPQTFSYTAAVGRSAASTAANPGYKSADPSVTVFFGDRGAGQFASSSLFDLSLQYSLPISRVTPWVKVDVRNLFNSDTLLRWNTSVRADANSPKDSMGYATGYTKSSAFGRPTSTTSYVLPRQYLVYVGVRF